MVYTVFRDYLNEAGIIGSDTTFPFFQSTVIVLDAPLGVLPNEYDSRQPAQVKSLKALLGKYPHFIFPAFIADRSAYREASAARTPVWRLKNETDGRMKTSAREAAIEMQTVFRMLLDRMEAQA